MLAKQSCFHVASGHIPHLHFTTALIGALIVLIMLVSVHHSGCI